MTHLTQIAPERSLVTADDVLKSHFTLVSMPGAIECIAVDGAEGWTSPNPHPALSLMRWTTKDKAKAADALDEVLGKFRKMGRGLEWMTGPDCQEAGLTKLLKSRGFEDPPLYVAAMSKTLSVDEPEIDIEGTSTWKVPADNCDHMGRVMARGFNVPDEVGEIFHRAYLHSTDLQTSDVYAAAPKGSVEPAGAGYLSYIGDGPAVLLRASSTLTESRGQGLYKALVAHRLADAAKRGRTEAFVQAYSQGSRLCLTGMGFRTLGGLALHRWQP